MKKMKFAQIGYKKISLKKLKEFVPNKYFKWYLEICKISCDSSSYGENHHILPRCKFPDFENEEWNIVRLTARQHYIAHLLLTKCTTGKLQESMIFAAMSMTKFISDWTKERYFIKRNSLVYEALRKDHSEGVSKFFKNYWKDSSKRELQSKRISSTWKSGKRDDQLLYMRENSPLRNPEIHRKSIRTRTLRGSNIFETKNPMLNPESIAKKVSKTSGNSHYMRKKISYFYSVDSGRTWKKLDIQTNLKKCLKDMGWSYATFFGVLNKQTPASSGPLKGILIRRENKENN